MQLFLLSDHQLLQHLSYQRLPTYPTILQLSEKFLDVNFVVLVVVVFTCPASSSWSRCLLLRLYHTILPCTMYNSITKSAEIIQTTIIEYLVKGDNVQLFAGNICRSAFRSSRARTLSWSSGSLPCSLGNQPIHSIALYYISCYLGSEPTKKSKYH